MSRAVALFSDDPAVKFKAETGQSIEKKLADFPERLQDLDQWFPSDVTQALEAKTMVLSIVIGRYDAALDQMKSIPKLYNKTSGEATSLGWELVEYVVGKSAGNRRVATKAKAMKPADPYGAYDSVDMDRVVERLDDAGLGESLLDGDDDDTAGETCGCFAWFRR